jgi:hypothetical protein
LARRISTGVPRVQLSHQWRLLASKRRRVPHESQTNTSFGFFLFCGEIIDGCRYQWRNNELALINES